jgi:dTDP-4-amino-4,6-dideoxygalactose transaminase
MHSFVNFYLRSKRRAGIARVVEGSRVSCSEGSRLKQQVFMMVGNTAEERCQNARAHSGYEKGDFPVSDKLPNEVPSLPLSPELTPDKRISIANEIREFLHR